MKRIRKLLFVFMIAIMISSCGARENKPTVLDGNGSSVEKEQFLNLPEETVDKMEEDLSEEMDKEGKYDLSEEDYAEEYSVYHNPIDQYFLSQIYSWDASQVEIRKAQNDYNKAWKSEYKNVMKWLRKKCIYEEDRKNIKELENSIAAQIEIEKKVIETEMINAYEINPDPGQVKNSISRISLIGNGTHDRLNQCEGEIYRDVSMRIIHYGGGEYKFQFQEGEVLN